MKQCLFFFFGVFVTVNFHLIFVHVFWMGNVIGQWIRTEPVDNHFYPPAANPDNTCTAFSASIDLDINRFIQRWLEVQSWSESANLNIRGDYYHCDLNQSSEASLLISEDAFFMLIIKFMKTYWMLKRCNITTG